MHTEIERKHGQVGCFKNVSVRCFLTGVTYQHHGLQGKKIIKACDSDNEKSRLVASCALETRASEIHLPGSDEHRAMELCGEEEDAKNFYLMGVPSLPRESLWLLVGHCTTSRHCVQHCLLGLGVRRIPW